MVGDGAALLVQRALGAAGVDPGTSGALDRFLALYDERLLDTTRLYPGLRRALRALDPLLALAVLTNKPRRPTERLLEALQLREPFVEVVAGDGPLPRKPNPAGLLSLRRHAAGGPMVLVGDSPVDAETARRGGVLPSCWPATGSAPPRSTRRRRRSSRRCPRSCPVPSAPRFERRRRRVPDPEPGVRLAVSTSSFDAARVPMMTTASSRPRSRTASAASSRDRPRRPRRASIRGARRSAGTPHPDR